MDTCFKLLNTKMVAKIYTQLCKAELKNWTLEDKLNQGTALW
jgi:hypothetical protein